jgi:methylthioribulose-1-phosphate dehydratase
VGVRDEWQLSAVLAHDPLRLAITASGIDKASLSELDIVEVDDRAQLVRGDGRPSAEAHLHVAVVKARGAGAVLQTLLTRQESTSRLR